MPTHLTRLVIRRILSNEPIVYRGCLYRRPNACLHPRLQRIRRDGLVQTRSFFGFAREPERNTSHADLAPGLEKLIDLNRAQSEQSRPPDLESLCAAFNKLMRSRNTENIPLSDVEAGHALNALRYLDENRTNDHLDLEDKNAKKTFPNLLALEDTMTLTETRESPRSASHLALAEKAFSVMIALRYNGAKESKPYSQRTVVALGKLLATMSSYGEPLRARDMLLEKYKNIDWHGTNNYPMAQLWLSVLKGFYTQGDRAEAQQTLQMLQESEISAAVKMKVKNDLLVFHAERGDMESTRTLWGELADDIRSGNLHLTPHTYRVILLSCLDHKESEWGQTVVRSMLEILEVYYSNKTNFHLLEAKTIWDAIFLWAAGNGKGVDEVDRMMNIMVRRTFANGASVQPDVTTINNLVSWCMSRNEPYFAERYISLGLKWGIHPDATTYNLQVQYRLSGGDIDGARAAYRLLQAEDCSNREDISAANQLIQAMCAAGKYPFNAIMTLVADLTEQKARFWPDTVSALSVLHLQRNELHDVIDLLQTHVYRFSKEQRLKIADSLVVMVMDRAHTSNTRAWDTYIIAQSIFTELPRETRTDIMREFFARGRADMACHVFAHMRDLTNPATKATADTYVAALTGIAEFAMPRVSAMDTAIETDERDAESASLLDAVHNAMKLDLDIEPDTRLRNALMLAYAACGKPARAWGFWEDIVNSREGPSYNSIPIAFRACERMTVGGEKNAKALWHRIRKMDIEVTKGMLAAYVGALAGNQNVEEAQEVLLKAEREFGWRPDTFILGTLFNAAYGIVRQQMVERWIQAKFPTQWVELQRLGAEKMDDGPRLYNIDRRLTP